MFEIIIFILHRIKDLINIGGENKKWITWSTYDLRGRSYTRKNKSNTEPNVHGDRCV